MTTLVRELSLYQDLVTHLFKQEDDFLRWCSYEYEHMNRVSANCLHHTIGATVACETFSSAVYDSDKEKYMFKKSTLYTMAKKWCDSEDIVSKFEVPLKSTKIPAYHLSFFASFWNANDDSQSGVLPTTPGLVRHLCGCGQKGCCSKDHMKWGTDAENKLDHIYHAVRDRECTTLARYLNYQAFCVNKHDNQLII